ncbi:hypothetical protein [Flavobacterium sp. F52]|uniref:hypothetical protein n=1 Tax=Flavobacterium sp. F52 TaxID=1202532 RepID=UPI000272D85A|nr:hypothetical protein [Flavobacterium sp. F52]EJG03161.1 hypothetical protein FF52_03175 [Flavobacterium sp. F52]
MSLVYTITSGYLECQDEKVNIPFALVFLEDGVYRLEINLEDHSLHKKYEFAYYYKLVGITEKKYEIECTGLLLTKHNSYNNKIEFRLYGDVKLVKPNSKKLPNDEEDFRERIWFVELENFKTSFANFTQITRRRGFSDVDDFFTNTIADHTETTLVIDNLKDNGNYFKVRIIQKINSQNLLLDFTDSEGRCRLYYDDYLSIKKDLISLLSFMNGAAVKIRKEYIGEFYGQSNAGYFSQAEINYSFLDKHDDSYNDYLQINYHHSYSDRIFWEIFSNCFNRFRHFNEMLDFSSLIFSLNVSTQTIGLKERYFILITALEKIAKKYSESINQQPGNFIDNEFFEKHIKVKLLDSILPVKEIDKDAWNRMNSILSNLNKNNSSSKNLLDFLIFAKIPISASVKKLVKKERNLAVHEGNIGNSDEEMRKNYLKLDHILRDVILNLIGYFGARNRKGLYATIEEFEQANPKSNNRVSNIIIKP